MDRKLMFKIGKVKYEIFDTQLWKNNSFLKCGTFAYLKDYLRYRYKRYQYHYQCKLPRVIAKIIGEPYEPQRAILDCIGIMLCQS